MMRLDLKKKYLILKLLPKIIIIMKDLSLHDASIYTKCYPNMFIDRKYRENSEVLYSVGLTFLWDVKDLTFSKSINLYFNIKVSS